MKIMTVRAPEELQSGLKKQARIFGVTRNALVVIILKEWLESRQQESRV